MFSFLTGDVFKMIGVGVICAFLFGTGGYFYGKREGKLQAATQALERSVTVLRDRNKIDENVTASDSSALCADFFVPDSADYSECMRRLEETNTKPVNGSDNHSN